MRAAGRFGLCLAICFSSAVSAQEQPSFFSDTFWAMRPAETAAAAEPVTRTARLNEFLFEQNITSAVEAIVQSRVELAVPGALGARVRDTVTFEPGDGLISLDGAGSRAVFCDRRVSWASRNAFDGRRLRACLIDNDRDGILDRVMWAGSVEGNFAPMVITALSADSAASVPYATRSEQNSPLIVAGPIINRAGSNTYRVAFAVSGGGEPHVLENFSRDGRELHSGVRFRASEAPIVVDLMGARLEIVGIEGGIISYRVLSEFDPATQIQIAYSGSMGRDVAVGPN